MSNDTLNALTNFYFDGNVTLSTLRRNITEVRVFSARIFSVNATSKLSNKIFHVDSWTGAILFGTLAFSTNFLPFDR